MRYIFADKDKAVGAGFSTNTHMTNDTQMALNEKEVMFNSSLKGTLEERAASLGGMILMFYEARNELKTSGWKIG